MHVVQVSCVTDRLRRTPADLLDGWPTLGAVAEAVRIAGANVTVVLSSHRDNAWERGGVKYRFVAERLSGGSALTGYLPAQLARIVGTLKPDVVHMNGFGFPFHTRALCAQGAPVLVQHHADDPSGRMRNLKKWGLARIAAVAFASREQAQSFVKRGYFDAAVPVFEIPESSTRFQPGYPPEARCATGIYGSPAILWIGHLNQNKDPLTVLEGFGNALQKLPNAHLWCCYRDAPLLDRIKTMLAANFELAPHVHLMGPVDHANIEQLCRAADFVVLGSRREGYPFSIVEGLACGATPVVTDIPAFRAMTGGGKIGALWEPGNPEALAAALISLSHCSMDDLRARAIAHFQEELSFPVVGKKLIAAYEAVIVAHAGGLGARR